MSQVWGAITGRLGRMTARPGFLLVVAVVCLNLASMSREVPWGDARPVFDVAVSMVRGDGVAAHTRWPSDAAPGKDGRFYAAQPWLPSLLHLPGAAVRALLGRLSPGPEVAHLIDVFSAHLAGALLGAFVVWLFFRLCLRHGASPKVAGLTALARATAMTMGLRNVAGDNVGSAIWDTNQIIRGLDPQSVGYDFDPGSAAAAGGVDGWWVALRLALPRLKMATLNDFTWSKDASGAWKATACPLGEGMVDWSRFFGMLARVKFTGPLSIEMGYRPAKEVEAIRRDLEFVRKQVAAAYGG